VTEEDEKALAEAIADELEDSAYGIATGADRIRTALLVVDRIQHDLYRLGWMPPETYENVQAWATRTASLPEHHVNRDVLTSHLTELAAILHDR
jgi:DNA-binding response OmpR family regulator